MVGVFQHMSKLKNRASVPVLSFPADRFKVQRSESKNQRSKFKVQSPKSKVQSSKFKVQSPKSSSTRVGVDTGGTFTDFVFAAGGRLQIFKIASTPGDPSIAIIDGLRRIAEMTHSKLQDLEVVHGTTVGTNALLQRRGARAALVTTNGFEDVLAIGRQARPELYNLDAVKAPPLVPDDLRLGVRERVAREGEILETLDDSRGGERRSRSSEGSG